MSSRRVLWLGAALDDAGQRTDTRIEVDPADLTTHGVIVGMTGSGKTGLGVVLLEEALLQRIPVLVIDPKGDMGNLLLNFPELRPDDFRPWIDTAGADSDADTVAAQTADTWRSGLESWGIDAARMRALKDAADLTIYTPGSTSGTPINVLGALDASTDADAEARADEIEAFVSGVLTLIDRPVDPVAGREHILLSNLVARAWEANEPIDLAGLVAQVANPPIRKLGVFDLDTFFPADQRMKLAVQLNSLLASPAFATWLQGAPLDIGRMLYTAEGKPRGAIVTLAHLSDAERQFVVTLLLSKLVSWMRRQPGTSDLRALVYMDEVFGFAPPTAEPPSKKPILTILKQARAHGVGLVLSTQNPVDLDYKAMSNAGTWMIGRLQTERDRDRIVEGMRAAAGDTDLGALATAIGGLGKRQFLLHTARGGRPQTFTTRWAMSYLRGPLTRVEIERLMRDRSAPAASAAETTSATAAQHDRSDVAAAGASHAAPAAAARAEEHDDATVVAPAPPSSIPVRYLDPAAPWAAQVGARAGGRRMQAAVAARVHLRFDDRAAGIDHTETWECIWYPLSPHMRAQDTIAVDYDDRDLRTEPPPDAVYVVPDGKIRDAAFYRTLERDLNDWLYRERSMEVLRNEALKLYSRVGEDEAAFLERCRAAADEQADAEAAKLRDRYEQKVARLQQRLRDAERRIQELNVDTRTRTQQELVAGAGALLSMFLGGRRSTRSLSGFASRRSVTVRTKERLESAKGKAKDVEAQIAELEQDLADELQAIADRWDEAASRVTSHRIPLDRTDIRVEQVVLLWVPT